MPLFPSHARTACIHQGSRRRSAMYDARNLRQFVFDKSQHSGWASARKGICAVRMFLRFLISQGRCPDYLYASIPTFAHWRLSALPFYLQADQSNRSSRRPIWRVRSEGETERFFYCSHVWASGERHCSASARRPRLERRNDPSFRKGTPPNRVPMTQELEMRWLSGPVRNEPFSPEKAGASEPARESPCWRGRGRTLQSF